MVWDSSNAHERLLSNLGPPRLKYMYSILLNIWNIEGPCCGKMPLSRARDVNLFLKFPLPIVCEQKANDLSRLCDCARWPKPSLLAYMINTLFTWAGSFPKCENRLNRFFGKILDILRPPVNLKKRPMSPKSYLFLSSCPMIYSSIYPCFEPHSDLIVRHSNCTWSG